MICTIMYVINVMSLVFSVVNMEYFKQEPVLVEDQVVYYEQSGEVKQGDGDGDGDDLEELLQESPCKQNPVEVRTE